MSNKNEIGYLINFCKNFISNDVEAMESVGDAETPERFSKRIYFEFVDCGFSSVKERIAMLTVLEETVFMVDTLEGKFGTDIQVFFPSTRKCVDKFSKNRRRFNTAGKVWRTHAESSWRDDFGKHHSDIYTDAFHISKVRTFRKKMRHK